MRLFSKVTVGVAITLVLGLSVLTLTTRSASNAQIQALDDGDPIILKGGSLTIQCPYNDDCLPFNPTTKKHERREKGMKVKRIVIKDENGNVVANVSKANFPNGKPTIEIYMK
jgi:hypothetical protein